MSTLVSCLTPDGSGAIAVIAVRGENAWPIARSLFRPASKKPLPDKPDAGSTWFGHIGVGDGAGDEVILAVPTVHRETVVEIHCHGGRQVVRWLIGLLVNAGCVEDSSDISISPAGVVDRVAWSQLPYAKTLRTAAILLDQAQGAFQRAMGEIDRAFADGRTADVKRLRESLLRYEPVGWHLIEPWKVAIIGAPNAGKSSLLNVLAGYQRSIVAPIPGTTRDVVTATLAFDGWPVEIADTAGLREGGDTLEREGIERARRQMAVADLCLWVIDATEPEPVSVQSFAYANGIACERILPVLNKTDLPAAFDLARIPDAVLVSAATCQGIDALIRRMVDKLVPDPPPPGAAVPFPK